MLRYDCPAASQAHQVQVAGPPSNPATLLGGLSGLCNSCRALEGGDQQVEQSGRIVCVHPVPRCEGKHPMSVAADERLVITAPSEHRLLGLYEIDLDAVLHPIDTMVFLCGVGLSSRGQWDLATRQDTHTGTR